MSPRKSIAVCVLFAATAILRAEQPASTTVFRIGDNGYKSIRIPSLIVASNGTLLAFAEGRQGGDQAQNDIILRRSTDGGKTWNPMQIISDMGRDSLNNPCAVMDAKTGRILLMFQQYPAHIHERSRIQTGFEGTNIIRSFVSTSDDHGANWTKPADITRQVKHATGATTLATGPGVGIQLTMGAHAGRLVMPINEGPFGRWQVYAAYSDDGGSTWACGRNAPGCIATNAKGAAYSKANEVQMAELSDGSIRLISRQENAAHCKTTAVSKDGGETWSSMEDVPALYDSPCMSSVIRFSPSQLAFSGPTMRRTNGTLFTSADDGMTWSHGSLFRAGPFAYSCLTLLPGGRLGCLYETGETNGAERIDFAVVSGGDLPRGPKDITKGASATRPE